jgi:tetratricopeptide (TPR) repeat protein
LWTALGAAQADNGRFEDAERSYGEVIRLEPRFSTFYGSRASMRAILGKWEQAIADYREAVHLEISSTERFGLAHALAKAGHAAEAQKEYAAAMEATPAWPETAAKTAWHLATSAKDSERNGARAALLAEQANEARAGRQPEILDVLAAAYAEANRFGEAATTAEKAIKVAEEDGKKDLADQVRKRAELYRQKKPFRTESGQPRAVNESPKK